MFTHVIAQEIFGCLSYNEKRVLSLSHRDFEFKKMFQFRTIQKYTDLISDWEVFRNDTLSVFQHVIDDILSPFDSREFGKLLAPRMGML